MKNEKPILGITMGDPASIGPEVALKALLDAKVYEVSRPVLVGEAAVFEQAIQFCELDLKVNRISKIADAQFEKGIVDVFDLNLMNIADLKLSEITAGAGDVAFKTVVKNIELALAGAIDGTVTGPIHKESIQKAGHDFAGHTEIYAHYTNTKKYGMLLVEENLRVIHVSTHVSLRQACDLVKKDRILECISLIDAACRKLGVENPKIGVAGLNPHASDGGLFGYEEEQEIFPAVQEAIKKGFNVEGPIPADTLFSKAVGGMYDGCVAMYHDQGHIPFKTVGFNWDQSKGRMKSVKGVNITLGLPIIRTSVDHGTAMEIAGQGIASPDAMVLAIEYAARLHNNKNNN